MKKLLWFIVSAVVLTALYNYVPFLHKILEPLVLKIKDFFTKKTPKTDFQNIPTDTGGIKSNTPIPIEPIKPPVKTPVMTDDVVNPNIPIEPIYVLQPVEPVHEDLAPAELIKF